MTQPNSTAQRFKRRMAFGEIADLIRREYEARGWSVYISTNTESITVTQEHYVGGGEIDVHLKLRVIP